MDMTVFLDLGSKLMLGVLDRQSGERESKADDDDMMEDYLNLVISFQEAPAARAGFLKIRPAHPEPRPDMIHLLTRLKSRYCMRIAVIGNETFRPGDRMIRNTGLKRIADFYITSSILTRESIGGHGIVHVNYVSTRTELASFGLCDF